MRSQPNTLMKEGSIYNSHLPSCQISRLFSLLNVFWLLTLTQKHTERKRYDSWLRRFQTAYLQTVYSKFKVLPQESNTNERTMVHVQSPYVLQICYCVNLGAASQVLWTQFAGDKKWLFYNLHYIYLIFLICAGLTHFTCATHSLHQIKMATFTKYDLTFLSLIYNHNHGHQDNIIL